MDAPKRTRAKPVPHPEDSTGLVANGVSGRWRVDLDETLSGKQRWFLQIEGPSAYVYFELASPAAISAILECLTPASGDKPRPGGKSGGREDPVPIGSFNRAPVALVRDDEFTDRYFLIIGPAGGSCLRLSLIGDDAAMLAEAFRQVRDDLGSDGDA